MLLASALLWLAPTPTPLPADDVRGALERLSDASAVQRQAAERWLASHLDPGDLEALAEVATSAGLEVQTRLANALGSDDRHFGLAALLAADYDPGLRRIGRSALDRMVGRWYGEEPLAPVPTEAVERAIADQFPGRLFAMRVGERSLDEEVASVARRMGRPEGLPSPAATLGVAVDPLLYERHLEGRPNGPATLRGASARRFEGTADFLLLATALWRERITVEGFAFNGANAWLHVVDRDQAGTRTGRTLLAQWCRDLLEYPDQPEGEGAARALAGTAWPAALAWMAERWFEHGDRNALAGLLLAAERGRITPGLATASSVERLLRAADRAIRESTSGLEFSEEVLRAIAAMGPVGSDGSDLTAVVAEGWEGSNEVSARLRLGILAGMGRAPAPVRLRLREILSSDRAPLSGRLRLEALRTLFETSTGADRDADGPWVAHDPKALYDTAAGLGLEREVHLWLLGAEARPPVAWRDPSRLSATLDVRQRTRVMDWWFAADPSGQVAGAHLLALASGPKGLSEEIVGDRLAIRERRGDRAGVERAFEHALELGGAASALRLERLALLAGVLQGERHLALFEGLVAGGGIRDEDLPLVGALAASAPVGEPARMALATAARSRKGDPSGLGMRAPWVRAYARTLTTLRRGARDADGSKALEARLLKDLREELGRSRHPLAARLRTEVWPSPPGLQPVSIEPLEVHLGP